MRGTTHLAAGAALGAAASPHHLLGGAVAGALAAIVSDADHPGSLAGRRLRGLALALEADEGHRGGVTHTVWFLIVPLAAALVPGAVFHVWWPLPAACLGFLSHLALDGLTRSGIRPLALPVKLKGEGISAVGRLRGSVAEWNEGPGAVHFSGPVRTGRDWRETEVMLLAVIGLLWTLAR